MARPVFEIGEYYHVYNRGVEKRDVFSDTEDLERFLQSLEEFNALDPIGSIYEKTFRDRLFGSPTSKKPQISITAYCLNPNHYHLLLCQLMENGISKFMQKLGTGYTKYFNEKNKRTGVLFQGKFKAKHIDSNEYLLRASVYINLNNRIGVSNTVGGQASKLSASSWEEYCGKARLSRCNTDIILQQFRSVSEYKVFSESAFENILENKKLKTETTPFL